MKIGVYKVGMASPSDMSEVIKLLDSGEVDAEDIVALIGKTEGNGGANDFTRAFATLSFQLLLAERLKLPLAEITKRICFVWSGGTEGVLSPHATLFTRKAQPSTKPSPKPSPNNGQPRLAMGIAMTRDLLPEEVGTLAQVNVVADAVRAALAQAGISNPADVHYVQVKGPLLTPVSIADADKRGAQLVTRDPNGSKSYARSAMALGVAVALGEVDAAAVDGAAIARRMDLFSSVASTSAGGELTNCEILLFGNSPSASSDFVISHGVLRDAIDAATVRQVLQTAGISGDGALDEAMAARVAAVFAKSDISPTGRIRGWRTTMLSDADINYERHSRAAVGAVIASVTGNPAIFVSGGTEHQCPPGQMPIAAIVRV
ncbi:MAG: cyanuric acid amidohydrolase [Herbaspirillum sp.]|nr:cyanuric acid amidohydrolase [Herbaspirillum sp.]